MREIFHISNGWIEILSSFFTVLLIGLAVMVPASASAQNLDDKALVDYHRGVIGTLSGEISGEDRTVFKARATRRERAVARDHLVQMIADIGLTAERQRYKFPNEHPVLDLVLPLVSGVNIVATIPATTDTDRVIVLGAHYDSVHESPGANDNGSGVAIILSTARTLLRIENRDATIIIVFFDQEEGGSFGSRAFASKLKAQNANVHSVHTVDMAGSDSDGDRVVEIDVPDAMIEAVYRSKAEGLDVPLSVVTYNSSDHLSFRDLGFTAICISEEVAGGDMTPHYHANTDRIEHVDLAYTARVSRLLTAALTEITSR